MEEVKLHGFWPSPFVYRVIWALKWKGIPYEYIEEDVSNKSPQLLQYNPIYKMIPVLVHNGKPICESMIIVQYIDKVWPQNSLLPSNPHEEAVARFWIKFSEDKGSCVWDLFRTSGEEQEKAIEASLEMLKIIEEHALGDKKFFGGENINVLDINYGAIAYWLGIIEEVSEVKVLDAEKLPRLHAWINNFLQVPVIKENLPNPEKLAAYFKHLRDQRLAAAAASSS